MAAEIAASTIGLRWRLSAWGTQNRNASYLTINALVGAGMGFAFWLFVTRWTAVATADVGTGYAFIALATLVGVLAKGGLDTALMRHVPGASRRQALHLFRVASAVGVAIALALVAVLGAASTFVPVLPALDASTWMLVGVMAALLVVAWLQDAYSMGLGTARPTLQRNVVLGVARVAIVVPVAAFAWPQPVALAGVLAVAVSVVAAWAMGRAVVRSRERPAVEPVSDGTFLVAALRNAAGGAAELAPGLVLAPLVLAVAGPAEAAYFAIAWAAASILFVLAIAISRSALVELVRGDAASQARAVRRGLVHQAVVLAPAAIVGIAFAPRLLAVFGPEYAREGALAMAILCASALFVGPAFLYLAVLRARDDVVSLVALPLFMIVALVLLAPPLLALWGLPGVAVAWLGANVPMGALAGWKLHRAQRGGERVA